MDDYNQTSLKRDVECIEVQLCVTFSPRAAIGSNMNETMREEVALYRLPNDQPNREQVGGRGYGCVGM